MSLKTCRSCLCESNEMKNIFNIELTISESDKRRFIDCFNAITDIDIKEDDKVNTSTLPATICEKCENDLIFSYKFRLQCQKSDLELKSRFVVKTEVEDENIVLEPIVEINIGLESSSESEQLMNEADNSDSEEDTLDEEDVESEPSPSSIRRSRSRRKTRQKSNENVSSKKALHSSILNCQDVGDIKAVFKCIHCNEVRICSLSTTNSFSTKIFSGLRNIQRLHKPQKSPRILHTSRKQMSNLP